MSSGRHAVPAPRWSDVYLVAGARGVSRCGDFVANTALVLALQGRGAGGYAVAAVLMATIAPPAALAPVVGRIVDRFDSRRLVVVSGLIQVVVCTALAYAASLPALVVLLVLLGIGYSITQATLSALMPDMVGKERLPKANALSQTAVSAGLLIAPAIGALLFHWFGLRVALLADAGSYLVIVAAGLAIRTRRYGRSRPVPAAPATASAPAIAPSPAVPTVAAAPAPGSQPALAGSPGSTGAPPPAPPGTGPLYSAIRHDELLRPVVVLFGAVVAAVSAVNVVDVFFVRATLHAPATAYGLLTAAWMAGMIGGAAWLGRRTIDDRAVARLMIGLLSVESLVIALAAGASTVIPMFVLWAVGGIANGGANVVVGVAIGRRAAAEARGRMFAALSGVANAGTLTGYIFGGLLLAVAAPRILMLAAGCAGLLAVVVFGAPLLLGPWRERRRRRRERPAASVLDWSASGAREWPPAPDDTPDPVSSQEGAG